MPPIKAKNKNAELHNLSNNNVLFAHRERVSIADINAGLTVLPAVPNYKYRVLDITMIPIAGAVTGATDVRVLGTQSAVSVALLVGVAAALLQSAILRAGVANMNVLAAGLSFIELDVNTPITVGKTGGAAATATHVDFLITYQLIPSRSGA